MPRLIARDTLLRILVAVLMTVLGFACVALVVSPVTLSGTHENWGVASSALQSFKEDLAKHPRLFSAAGDDPGRDHASEDVRLYRAALFVETPNKPWGQQFKTDWQETGDCVSQGLKNAIRTRMSIMALKGLRTPIEPFAPYHFGVARQIATQTSCRSSGADPTAAIRGFEQYGTITAQEAGVPYSGALADRWGCQGPPAELLAKGKSRAGKAHPIRSVEELCEAITNGYPCTWTTWSKPLGYDQRDGRHVVNRWGSWAHQMCFVGYDGTRGTTSDRQYFLVWNSHGADPAYSKHPLPLGDEPPGSFWVSWADMDRLIKSGNVVYAVSDVSGFEADGDIGPTLDRLLSLKKDLENVRVQTAAGVGPHVGPTPVRRDRLPGPDLRPGAEQSLPTLRPLGAGDARPGERDRRREQLRVLPVAAA